MIETAHVHVCVQEEMLLSFESIIENHVSLIRNACITMHDEILHVTERMYKYTKGKKGNFRTYVHEAFS